MKSGAKLKKEGMQLSLFNAELKDPGWKDMALNSVKQYIEQYPLSTFQTEDIRLWAYRNGLPKPPNDRAWGSVINTAKRLGIIQFKGYRNVTNPRAHCTPAAVWVKA